MGGCRTSCGGRGILAGVDDDFSWLRLDLDVCGAHCRCRLPAATILCGPLCRHLKHVALFRELQSQCQESRAPVPGRAQSPLSLRHVYTCEVMVGHRLKK